MKIISPFTVDEKAEFKFSLVLESTSLNANSLMDSDGNNNELKARLDRLANNSGLKEYLKDAIKTWKEKHK